ncbi:MAG: ABC transporter permease [Phycisphaeraceae bacterium]
MSQDLAPDNKPPVTVIAPRRRWQLLDARDLWRHRELLWILAMRALKMRYKQTVVGALWAVIQPVAMMVVFTAVMRGTGANPIVPGVPYPISLYVAMLPWQLFASSLRASSDSLVTNQRLITKVYFPRVIVPIAPIVTSLVDFLIAALVLVAMMVWYGIVPTWTTVLAPLMIALAVMTSVAAGLWLSALNALYRDVRYALPFLIQIGMFVSPVIYDTTKIPDHLHLLYSLNPMVGVIEGMRWAVLGYEQPPLVSLAMSAVMVTVLLIGGLAYFRRMESTIVDRV